MTENIQPQYGDYADLIRKEAWQRVKHNPLIEFSELISQGNLAFDKAARTWDPAKGKFSTLLWWWIRHYMGQVQGCHHYVSLDDPEVREIADERPSPYDETKFRLAITSMSQEATEVVWLVLTCPWELVDWTINRIRPSQSTIRQFLHSLGWGNKKIDQAFTEVKTMLEQL